MDNSQGIKRRVTATQGGPGRAFNHRSDRGLRARVACIALGLVSTLGQGPALSQLITARETAGWHLLRPGESLESLARLYLGKDEATKWILQRNPGFEELGPGDRVQIELRAGLPPNAALVSVTGGRVDEQPTPVSWMSSRRWDLLTGGDGVRTFSPGSAELWFADWTRLLVTEDSLVLLGEGEPRPKAGHPGEIELIVGQTDLKHGVTRQAQRRRRPQTEAIEIVMGPARARPRTDTAGRLDARARRTEDGAQLMVFQGTSELVAAGTTVRLDEGTGSVVRDGGPPSPPQPLVPAPSLVGPQTGATLPGDEVEFRWRPVENAESYTLELCRDPDCAHLVRRQAGLTKPAQTMFELDAGRYFWRVTATTASLLDGFPSRSAELEVRTAPSTAAALASALPAIVGSVRVGAEALPLQGAGVYIVEANAHVTSAADGGFEFRALPSGSYTLEARLDGVVVGRLADVTVSPRQTTEVVLLSDAALLARDEIVVRPSRLALLDHDPMAAIALSQDDILALPHLADDLFRALPLMPGVTGNDVSAQFHIRGGRRDEVQVLLDGQELYDAFHLKDFDNAQSIVAAAALGSVDLVTGGWSAEHGDRMGGVLDMRTLTPPEGRRSRFGISLLNLHAGTSGTFDDERGSWLGMARRGAIDLAAKILGQEDPAYWDALGKTSYTLGPGSTLSGHGLLAGDTLRFVETEEDSAKSLTTVQDGAYLWLTHQGLLASRMFVDTFASWSRIEGRRLALTNDEDQDFEVRDRRGFDVVELRQSWNLQAGPRHLLAWGAGLRRFDATYDYFNSRRYDTVLAQIRTVADGEFRFRDQLRGDHGSAHITDRVRLSEAVILELGLRYDHHSWLRENRLSPRLNLAYSPARASVLRFAWGEFVQSQRPYELQVEDGETRLFPSERSRQGLVGYERVFEGDSRLAGMALRVEAYRREIQDPRPRYENLYEPFNEYPELEPDRVLIAAQESVSEGIEVFLHSPPRRKLRWWANYGLASVKDRIAGRSLRRQIDQTHTLNLSLSFPLGKGWILNAAWRYHGGWPTTPLSLVQGGDPGNDAPKLDFLAMDEEEEEEAQLVPVLGPLYSQRLSHYHRLDLRASRELRVARGRMMFFVDIQNVYNRKNLSGFDLDVDDEERAVVFQREFWPGFFPSVGLSWEF